VPSQRHSFPPHLGPALPGHFFGGVEGARAALAV
jgi:hypothetical protein